jgi:hypothetical protein
MSGALLRAAAVAPVALKSDDGEFACRAPHWNWLFCRLAPDALAARLGPTGFRVVPAGSAD